MSLSLFRFYLLRRGLGIFSLVCCFWVVNSFLPLEANQGIQLDLIASDVYAASFSYGFGDFEKRRVWPDSITFNASGQSHLFTSLTASTTPYEAWEKVFPSNSWSVLTQGSTGNPATATIYFRARQFPGQGGNFASETWVLTRMPSSTNQILAYSSTNATSVFTLSTAPLVVTSDAISGLPFATVLSKTKCHFFWISKTDSKIHGTEWDGVSTTDVSFPDLTPLLDKGIGGTLLESGGADYVAFTFIDAASQPVVVAYPEGNPAGKQVHTFAPVGGIAPRSQAEITQNPRTKRIFLLYQTDSGNRTAKLISSDFTWPNTWTNIVEEQIGGNNSWYPAPSFAITGLPNFENAAPIRDSGLVVRDCILRNFTWETTATVGTNGYPSSFLCKIDGIDHLGTAVLTTFATPTLRVRPLAYPSKRAWDKDKRALYLEGPPLEGTTVSVKATFPELASSSCRIAAVNQGTGLGLLEPSPGVKATGIIASAGTLIKLVFDESMMTASFPLWVGGEAKIQVLDAASVSIPLTAVSSTATELTFKLAADLGLNATYTLSISSGVLDLGGTQLWAPATFVFVTQPGVSGSLASEVIALEAYSDASRAPGFLIPHNTEINASSSLWFRLIALDPASNTFDLATLSPSLDGVSLASLSMSQPAASSAWFHAEGLFNAVPSTGTHLFRFQTASTSTFLQFPITFPDLTSFYPASGAVNVTVDRKLTLSFSEALATSSVTNSTVRLLHDGILSSYSVSLSGQVITIDPDDSSEGYLLTSSTYRIEVGKGVTDLVGNPFHPSLGTWSMSFLTQPTISPPTTVASITLFADAGFATPFLAFQAIPATQTVFIHVLASDVATLTRDLTTATLQLPWGPTSAITLTEVASNSGAFRGSIALSGIPLYGFPTPIPTLSIATITWVTQGASPVAASLTVRFPEWQPTSSFLLATGGTVLASGGTNIALNSQVILGFWPQIAPSSLDGISVLRNGVPIAASRTVDATHRVVSITPSVPMAPDETYEVSAEYVATGVRGDEGNPLHRPFRFRFFTQPANAPPATFTGLVLYRDAARALPFLPDEAISATQSVYLKVNALDRATQTRDVGTITFTPSWGSAVSLPTIEVASNSGGVFWSQTDLASLPVFGFPTPLPPAPMATVTWTTAGSAPQTGQLRLLFPSWVPASSTLFTVSGATVAASGATQVRLDSPIRLWFDPAIASNSLTTGTVILANGSSATFTSTVNDAGTLVTIIPTGMLQANSTYTISAAYDAGGLRGPERNPLHRGFRFTFSTQPLQTPPLSVASLSLFSAAGYGAGSRLANDADFPASGTMYVEILGSDAAPLTIDSTGASISTGLSLSLPETASNSGRFRGSFALTGITDGQRVRAISSLNPAASASVVVTFPQVSPVSPASGATGVSLATNIRLQISEDIDESSLSASSTLLFTPFGPVAATRSWISGNRQIVLTPASSLPPSTTVTVRVDSLRDLVGNPLLASFSYSFQTQNEVFPPLVITQLGLFRDSAFSAALPDNSLGTQGTELFIEVLGNDVSVTSTDSTPIRIESSSGASFSLSLAETGVATGRFRGSGILFVEENTTLTIRSITDPSYFQRIRLPLLPRIFTLSPASGSTSLPLDTVFRVTANKAIATSSVTPAAIFLRDATGDLVVTPVLESSQTIVLSSPLATGSQIHLEWNSGLKDLEGLPFQPGVASFSSRALEINGFSVFHDPAFTQPATSGSQISAGETLYAILLGSDLRSNASDTLIAFVNDGTATNSMPLIETSSGRFTGQFSAPSLPGSSLTVTPKDAPDRQIRLFIPGLFSLVQTIPASGAVGVPADTWPTWVFSQELDPVSVQTPPLSLIDPVTGTAVAGSLSLSPNNKTVAFIPSTQLTLLKAYEMRVDGSLRDKQGLLLGSDDRRRFAVQGPPPPPFTILALRNYRDATFQEETSVVSPDGMMYLEIEGSDPLPFTVDSTRVRADSSDGSIAGLELTLLETGDDSGRYRAAIPVSAGGGSTINLRSQGNPLVGLVLQVLERPRVNTISPASGSSHLSLDAIFQIDFDQAVASSTLASGVTVTDQAGNLLPTTFSVLAGGTLISLAPRTAWSTGTSHLVEVSGKLRGINDVGVSPLTFSFSTRAPSQAGLTLLTGTGPRQGMIIVSSGSEALPGILTVSASTTRLFERRPEFRTVSVSMGGATLSASIPGIATMPGQFLGSVSLPDSPGAVATCTLKFAANPAIGFVIAERPLLLERAPLENSTTVPEYAPISIRTNRPMATDLASEALSLTANGVSVSLGFTSGSSETTRLVWKPIARLPFGSLCSIASTTLYDRLGQALSLPALSFTVGGTSGINLFLDASFSIPLPGDVIPGSPVFVELAVPDGFPIEAGKQFLEGVAEHQASSPRLIPIVRIASESRRFRGRIDLGATASGTIGTWIPLSPGEKLELRRPGTSDPFAKSFYYLLKGDSPPLAIRGLTLFEDRSFLKRAGTEFIQSTLFIEVPADDRNHWFADTTRVRVFSDHDPLGFEVSLTETARHTGLFHGDVSIVGGAGNPALKQLSARSGDRLTVVSVPDPSYSQSLRWRPEGRLEKVVGWPNPVRGGRFTLNFWLTWPGDVEIFIYDASGDEVHTVFLRGREGENRWNWDIPRRIANGVYFYSLQVHQTDAEFGEGKKKVRGKFAILR